MRTSINERQQTNVHASTRGKRQARAAITRGKRETARQIWSRANRRKLNIYIYIFKYFSGAGCITDV